MKIISSSKDQAQLTFVNHSNYLEHTLRLCKSCFACEALWIARLMHVWVSAFLTASLTHSSMQDAIASSSGHDISSGFSCGS